MRSLLNITGISQVVTCRFLQQYQPWEFEATLGDVGHMKLGHRDHNNVGTGLLVHHLKAIEYLDAFMIRDQGLCTLPGSGGNADNLRLAGSLKGLQMFGRHVTGTHNRNFHFLVIGQAQLNVFCAGSESSTAVKRPSASPEA